MKKSSFYSIKNSRFFVFSLIFLILFLLAGIGMLFIWLNGETMRRSFNLFPAAISRTILRPVLFFTLSFLILSFLTALSKDTAFLTLRSKKLRIGCLLLVLLITLFYVLATVFSFNGIQVFPWQMDITFFLWTYNHWLFAAVGVLLYVGLRGPKKEEAVFPVD